MRFLQVSGGVILALWLAVAQVYAGSLTLLGAGKVGAAAVVYQGPGDIVASATAWGSCARVYQVSQASTATSLCDLVATTGGAVVCTLRGSATGFVDLAASYCAGTTPSAACAAASGGSCKVTKVYDQAGATGGFVQATLGNMPVLTFSALGGLPGMTFSAGSMVLATSGNITTAQPVSFTSVSERIGTAAGGIITSSTAFSGLAYTAGANSVFCAAAAGPTGQPTDSAFHAIQCVNASGASNNIAAVDGVAGTAQTSAVAMSGPLRIGRDSGGSSVNGVIMEVGNWPIAFNATQYGNLNTNAHSSTSGYNF